MAESRPGDELTVTVVIPARNAGPHLGSQLAALSRQTSPGAWEVIVSDNGSADDTRAVVDRFRERMTNLRIVDSSDRPGAAHARNVGASAGTGEAILFCDADDEVADGWLPAMTRALRTASLVAARVDRDRLNPGSAPSSASQEGLQRKTYALLPFAFGAALGVRRTLHDALGGFDEELADGCEDEDYCYRAQLAGQRLQLVPDAVVHYRVRSDLFAVYRQSRNVARGNVLLYRKYRGHGMPRPPVLRAVLAWPMLAVRLLPAMCTPAGRLDWWRRLGRSVGRLQGSVRYRVLAP